METPRTITGNTENDIWQQVAADMAGQGEWFEYEAVLQQGPYQMVLAIEIDLGGGFEGGSETTTLTARLPGSVLFRFGLHPQDWVHELGKLVGMTDVELGDPEIDAAFIITTNDPPLLHDLLADSALRQTLLRHPGLRLDLGHPTFGPDDELTLEFSTDAAISDPADLQEVYHLLLTLLQHVSPVPAPGAGPTE